MPAVAAAVPDGPSKPDWKAIRYEYETTNISQRDLAAKHHVPYSTLCKRTMRENWSQRAKLVAATASKLEAEVGEAIKQEIRDELAPLIAAKKVEITKRGIHVAERGLSRIESLWDDQRPSEAKVEADGARAAEIFLRLARTSLGMNDGTGLGGALNVNILANQAAIGVSVPQVESPDSTSQS